MQHLTVLSIQDLKMTQDCFALVLCFSSTKHPARKDKREGKRLGFMGWQSQAAWSSSRMSMSFPGRVCFLFKGVAWLFISTTVTFSFLLCLHGQLLPNIQVGASNSLLHPSNLRTSAYFQQFSSLTLLPSLIPVLHHEPQLLGSPIFPI